MPASVLLPTSVPALPEGWKPSSSSANASTPSERRLIPAGPAYLAHIQRKAHNLSFEEFDKRADEEEAKRAGEGGDGVEDDLGVGDEPESPELLILDPKEWKKQDHYAVLGLSKLRWRATDAQIKIAHRKKVLKHHPDKKAGAVGETNDDAFFKCISKATEVLSNKEKRRQYDSVDFGLTGLEAETPEPKDISKARDPSAAFFELYGPVFEREARFSRTQPVPMLGSLNDSKEEVESFYDFWYKFDSWRSFEYLDKEVNEGSDSRDDKRYTEKKNKTERARRKKEDIARLRSIVDNALSVDPRIKRIKEEEKAAREAKKKGKSGAGGAASAKAKAEETKRLAEEEAKKKAEDEKVAQAEAKKAKAAAANAAKKARRAARQTEDGAPAS